MNFQTDTPNRNRSTKPETPWLKFLGAGIELSGITLGFAAIGYGLDRWLGNDRLLATSLVTLLGFTLGMLRFVIRALNAMKPQKGKRD